MLTIKYQTAFKKDYKRIKKRGYNIRLLEEVIDKLANQKNWIRSIKTMLLSVSGQASENVTLHLTGC